MILKRFTKHFTQLAAITVTATTMLVGASSISRAIAAPDIYIYSDNIPDLRSRLATTDRNLARLPDAHWSAVDPIFIVDRLPGGKTKGGGYFTPGEVRRLWLDREYKTGVPNEAIQAIVLDHPNTGLVAITKDAFSQREYQFTVFHEVAHSIDRYLDITPPGLSISDFVGIRYRGRQKVEEYAAEAYARHHLVRHRICRPGSIPAGETQSACSRRLTNVLRQTPAFTPQ